MNYSKLIFIFIIATIPNLHASTAAKLVANLLKDKDLQQKFSTGATYISTGATDCYNQAASYLTSSEQDKTSQSDPTSTPKSKNEQSASIRATSLLNQSMSKENNLRNEVTSWKKTNKFFTKDDEILKTVCNLIEKSKCPDSIIQQINRVFGYNNDKYKESCENKALCMLQLINAHSDDYKEQLIQENACQWHEWTHTINNHEKS